MENSYSYDSSSENQTNDCDNIDYSQFLKPCQVPKIHIGKDYQANIEPLIKNLVENKKTDNLEKNEKKKKKKRIKKSIGKEIIKKFSEDKLEELQITKKRRINEEEININ